jgi:hypothetical protein
MAPLWKTHLPGENPALAESLERVMARVAPNPATAHWGMRGGFVKLKGDATLALQLAGNDLTLNGYREDLGREGIGALLGRLADALAGAFTLPPGDLDALRALAGGQGSGDDAPHEEGSAEQADPAPRVEGDSHVATSPEGSGALAELVLELVALNRGLHGRIVRLEGRVDALEGRDVVEETLSRAERLAQALRRS